MRVNYAFYEGEDAVPEEHAQALAANEVLREPVSAFLDQQWRRLKQTAAVAGALLVVGVGLLIVNGGGLWPVFVLGGLTVGAGGYVYTTRQEPEITLTGIEKGYWTAHSIPVEDGAVVYDGSEAVGETTFDLERLEDDDAIEQANQRLGEIEDFPVVMPNSQSPEEVFTDALSDVQAEIENAQRYTVSAPIIEADSPESTAVETFADMAVEDETTVDPSISIEEAKADVEKVSDLEQLAADDDTSDLESLSESTRNLANDLSGMQEMAIDLLNDHVGVASDAFGLVSYNFYCPDCLRDDIESLLTLRNYEEREWYCETCRSQHETEDVIPKHKLKDQLVDPVWDQLWKEKDDQRREIYANIEDQKAELKEREFEQRSEEIRTAADRIKDIRSRIRDLKTTAKAGEGTVEEIGDLMVKYEHLNRQRKEEFEAEVTDAFAEIDRKTDEILEETRNEEQERIEEAEEAAAEKAEMMREEERRREMQKFIAQQEATDERTRAQMEQQAELHEQEMKMEKRQHREDWMMKVRGGTSMSSTINKAKMKKDRVLGATHRSE